MSRLPSRRRSAIRVRLTVLYAGAFFVAGTALIGVMYLVVGEALDRQLTARIGISQHLTEPSSNGSASQQRAHEQQQAIEAQFKKDRNDTLDSVLIDSLVALGAVGIAAGGFGWLLAGRALRPLQDITATARRVADRSLHERIALDWPNDEIKDLADTFDAMLERLDRAFDSQRRFVANASHELRTPLTINRTLIQVALDKPDADEALRQLGTTLLGVNERHERLIDGLLTMASSEQGVTDAAPVDLADIARHLVVESRPAARDARIEMSTDLQPAPLLGDPVLLERLVQNLLDNAIRYNLSDGGIITVATATVDSSVALTIDNTGPLIAVYEVPSLFEPFRRLASTERLAEPAESSIHRGAGLGLSIVRSVAHAHGGEVHATARAKGGLTVHVRLPTRPPDPDLRQAAPGYVVAGVVAAAGRSSPLS
jgi:signal transduction histidine kinase